MDVLQAANGEGLLVLLTIQAVNLDQEEFCRAGSEHQTMYLVEKSVISCKFYIPKVAQS